MSLAKGSPIHRTLYRYCYGHGGSLSFGPGELADCGCHRVLTCEECGTTQLVEHIVVAGPGEADEFGTHTT